MRKDSGLDPSNFPDVLFRANEIAIANWEHAPYGQAAKEALESYGVFEKVKKQTGYWGKHFPDSQLRLFGRSGCGYNSPFSCPISHHERKGKILANSSREAQTHSSGLRNNQVWRKLSVCKKVLQLYRNQNRKGYIA